MNPTEAAKTMFAGFAMVLSVTAGAGAWGIFRGVVTSVPVSGDWVFLAVAVTAVASIPVAFAVIKRVAK
jgi:hypothetical protein